MTSILFVPTESSVSVLGFQLPQLCVYRRFTGMDCMGCGLTRSFVYMGHADVATAFRMNWVGPLLYVGVVSQIPFRVWRVWKSKR